MSGDTTLLVETQYFPPISLFRQVVKHPILLLEGQENYRKGGYRNRCYIAGPNGRQRLSVPLVKGKNSKLPIKEVQIDYKENWQKIHWQTIQTAYGKSPFFEFYAEEFHLILKKKWNFLFDMNLEIIQTIKEVMQLSYEIKETNDYLKSYDSSVMDIRNQLTVKKEKQAINSAHKYPQVFESKNGFLPNLSILDLLFCTGPEAFYYLENQD